jgi:hypothetical protein
MQSCQASYLHFQKSQEEYVKLKSMLFSKYMQIHPQNKETDCFICMNGCQESRLSSTLSSSELRHLFSTKETATRSGGYFLKLSQKGICINPSTGFLEQFCKKGLHLWDIHAILVTSSDPASSLELELLHELNKKLNETLVSYEQKPHVISYFMHPTSYARYALALRPVYPEEKGTIFCLETFQKEESIPLTDQATLYFANKGPNELLVRINSFGYCTGGIWDEGCLPFFQKCDKLLFGIGKVQGEDLEGIKEGSFSKALAAIPQFEELQLLFLSEFDSSLGDIRLAAARKFIEKGVRTFPLDHGFEMPLSPADSLDIRIVRPNEPFSQLLYLPSEHVL